MRPIDIVVAFFRNADLVSSLAAASDELRALDCTLIAVNDSPEDPALRLALKQAEARLPAGVRCKILENGHTLGFVRSVNRAFLDAVERGCDVLLLSADTMVYPGAVTEIQRVAYCDPMIGFVSPRSNSGTICSLPHQQESHDLSPEDAHRSFSLLSPHLPAWHFVPTAVGFCLFIKLEILEEFGGFTESYGMGYNQANDLIMRANRCGFRAALANRAFVYYRGERSSGEANSVQLNERYPEYVPGVHKYIEGLHYEAERLLATLIPDENGRLDLVFDFSIFGTWHNGTTEAAKEILARAVERWTASFNLYVMASDEAARVHKLDQFEPVTVVPPDTTRTFAVALRYGQPFKHDDVTRMGKVGLINVYGMLDPIALDCLNLNLSHADLDQLWSSVFQHADGVFYISDFVSEEFRRRFRLRPGLGELVTYLSLDYKDYESSGKSSSGSYLLVIGNAFAHKRVAPTVDALSKAFPQQDIVAIGLPKEGRRNVMEYPSGELTEEQIEGLWRGASLVIFPSLYEGFGIPVLKSLAHRKPVLARSIPVMQAIRRKLTRRIT